MAEYTNHEIAELVARGKEERDIRGKNLQVECAQRYCREARSNLLWGIGDFLFDSALATSLLMTYPQEVHQDKPLYAAASLLLGFYFGKKSYQSVVKNLPEKVRQYSEAKEACRELQEDLQSLEERVEE